MISRFRFFLIVLVGIVSFSLFKNKKSKNTVAPVSRTIKTLYGNFTVEDPLILDLLDCPAMQRLKRVHQFGHIYFIKDDEVFFTRYEHSVGVWALLKRYGASREEQIAGLLHDVSHTVFSHLGDFLFKRDKQDLKVAYQDDIHLWYIKQTTIPDILKKYKMSPELVDVKNGKYLLLEQATPDLCADRLEYNLNEGLKKDLINKKDLREILDNLDFEDGQWFFLTTQAARKFAKIPLYLTQNVWGAKYECLANNLVGNAIRRAMEIDLITQKEMHFSTDDVIWEKLALCDDPTVKKYIDFARDYKFLQERGSVQQHDYLVKRKFRGVNPWIKQRDGSFKRLVDVDFDFNNDFLMAQKSMAQGWPAVLKGTLAQNKQLLPGLVA